MNKQLLILLVAFVAVNAFVKRDAPAQNPNALDDAQAKLQEFADKLNTQLKQAFDPEKIKADFNKVVDTVNNALNQKTDKA